MHLIGALVAVAGAMLAGYLMWRRTTSTLYYRTGNSNFRPPDVSQEEYEDAVIAQRKRWRLIRTAIAAVAGALVAYVLFIMISSGLSRR